MGKVLKSFLIGLSIIIGAIGSLFGIYSYFFPKAPDMHRKDDIVGTWKTNYSYDDKGIIVTVKEKTSYFSNGKYNVSGKMSYKADKINNSDIYVSYLVYGAGEWEINDKELVTSLNDLKSTPEQIIYNGEILDLKKLSLLENITYKKFPAVEDMMANSASQSYRVIVDEHNYKTLDVINPFGKDFNIEMYREK